MRLPERTKKYASAVVHLYIDLPRSRKEVQVLGHQLLRSSTSIAVHTREASRARQDADSAQKLMELYRKPTSRSFGSSCYGMIAV